MTLQSCIVMAGVALAAIESNGTFASPQRAIGFVSPEAPRVGLSIASELQDLGRGTAPRGALIQSPAARLAKTPQPACYIFRDGYEVMGRRCHALLRT